MARPTEISTQTFRAPSPDQHDALQEYGLSLSLSLSLSRARALSLSVCVCVCVCACVRACVRLSLSLSLSLSLFLSLSLSLSLCFSLSLARSLARARTCNLSVYSTVMDLIPAAYTNTDTWLQWNRCTKTTFCNGAPIARATGTWAHSVRHASFWGEGHGHIP